MPYRDANGYVIVYAPTHPNAHKGGTILEHRKVMSDYIGRPLTTSEVVHHKNGVKHDNHIDNLELLNGLSAHVKIHHPKRHCVICGQFSHGHSLCFRHYKRQRYAEKKGFTRCGKCNKPIPHTSRLAHDGQHLCKSCRFPVRYCKLCSERTRASGMCEKHFKQWRYCACRGKSYDEFLAWLRDREAILARFNKRCLQTGDVGAATRRA